MPLMLQLLQLLQLLRYDECDWDDFEYADTVVVAGRDNAGVVATATAVVAAGRDLNSEI